MSDSRPLAEILPDRPPVRHFRHSAVVYVRELSEDNLLVSDKDDRNEYLINRETYRREYEEL